jgi:hypothetical protein
MTTMLSETWKDQYRRMHRQYQLLKLTADQNKFDEIQEMNRPRDILYHFCCDAFHLHDWIYYADGQTQKIKDAVSHFLPKGHPHPPSLALAMCADIANGFKHGRLTHKKVYTPGGPAEVVEHTQGARLPATFPFHFTANHWKIRTLATGVEYYALDVAKDAVAAWDAWLPKNGLPLPG